MTIVRCLLQGVATTATIMTAAMGAIVLSAGSAVAAGDMELGRYLASECMTCHRAGAASGPIPNIYGMNEKRISYLLKGYRDKSLPNDAMQNSAMRLKDGDIESLALFFSKTSKP